MFLRKLSFAFVLVALTGLAHADEWKEYNSADGRFTASFPGTPKQTKEKRQTKFGSLDAQLIILPVAKDVFYGVSYTDYPEKVMAAHRAEELLDGASDSAIKGVKGGRVAGQEKISLAGNPGRQVVIEAPGNLILTVRMYLVKNRLYQVLTSVARDKEKEAEPTKFLDSFKFAS